MKALFLPVILFLLLVLESVAVVFLPDYLLASELYYIPHWILVFSCLIVLFYDGEHSYNGIVYGTIFAFLTDLVYTEMLGVYLLAYGSSLYLIHLLKKVFHKNFAVALLMIMIGLLVSEFILYGLYSVVGHIDLPLDTFVQLRLIPTILINLLFFLFIYPIFSKRLISWKEEISK